MLPAEIAKSGTEHAHQCAVFAWANVAARYGIEIANDWANNNIDLTKMDNAKAIPILDWLFAIPNGGLRNIAVARKLKSEGLKKGVFDLFLPIPCSGYHGAFFEIKSPSGSLSKDQKEFGKYLGTRGYFYAIIRNVEIFKSVVSFYVGKGTI